MPDATRVTCKSCGKHAREVGAISWRGFCGTCGEAKAVRAATELYRHDGEFFQRWRRGMVACAGGVLLDESQQEG